MLDNVGIQINRKPAHSKFSKYVNLQGEKVVAVQFVNRLNDRFYGQWLMTFVPFKNASDFINEDMLSKVPAEHRFFAMAVTNEATVARNMWWNDNVLLDELRAEGSFKTYMETVFHMTLANRVLILDYINGKLDAVQELAERETRQHNPQQLGSNLPTDCQPTLKQRQFEDKARSTIDLVMRTKTEDFQDVDAARNELWESSKIIAVTGAPGTGKTAFTHRVIEKALEVGGKVLFALPTTQLASRMRARYGHRIVIDTCAASFAFDDPQAYPFLAMYALVVVDEISQLQGYQYQRIIQLWEQADRAVCVIVLGDMWQIAGFGDERVWHTHGWRKNTFKIKFDKPWRCQDPDLQRILDGLRTAKPDVNLLWELQNMKAWTPPHRPTAAGIKKLFHKYPGIVVLTCTRRGATLINNCALEAFFPRYPPRAILEGDVESNPDNYTRDNKLKSLKLLKPMVFKVYVGMQIFFTRNVRKDIDYVNGMDGKILGSNAEF